MQSEPPPQDCVRQDKMRRLVGIGHADAIEKRSGYGMMWERIAGKIEAIGPQERRDVLQRSDVCRCCIPSKADDPEMARARIVGGRAHMGLPPISLQRM